VESLRGAKQRGNLHSPSFQEGGRGWEESEPTQIELARKLAVLSPIEGKQASRIAVSRHPQLRASGGDLYRGRACGKPTSFRPSSFYFSLTIRLRSPPPARSEGYPAASRQSPRITRDSNAQGLRCATARTPCPRSPVCTWVRRGAGVKRRRRDDLPSSLFPHVVGGLPAAGRESSQPHSQPAPRG
jgi:hypothetical protein